MARLIFEIGTEELPPHFIMGALEQIKELARERLTAARLDFGEIRSYGTPRRLALVVEGLAESQESRMREEQGPPASRAFNEDGTPNNAAVGFASRWGIRPDELQVKETPRGDYIFAIFKEEGKSALEVLAELLAGLPGALYFPKTMRWGATSVRFGRPIRWLVALLDNQIVPFEIDGLQSGRTMRGHPVLHPEPVTLARAQDYESALNDAQVIIDQTARHQSLLDQLQAIAQQQGARLTEYEELLEDTVYLVEYPTAVAGSFDENYLKLPRPVLIEEMRKVQGFFPLENERGKLVAGFIGVRDGGTESLEIVQAGYQGVLRAKFEDATFFFEHDRRKPLMGYVEQLKGVVYQAGMGTMYDKAQRLQALAGYLADKLESGVKIKAAAERAALLAKADLVTDLVIDITSLQGIMGREYAYIDGEAVEVAQAIAQHYQPRSASDSLPPSAIGKIVALADKLDIVVSGLAAGLSVSGSEDPYGLRRESQAIVSILVGAGMRLSVPELVDQTLAGLAAQQELKRAPDEIKRETLALLRQRLERLLKEAPPQGLGVRYDLVDATLAVGEADFGKLAVRAAALQELSQHAGFLPTVVAATRPANIVKSFAGGVPDPALFSEPAESELWQATQAAQPKVAAQAQQGSYRGLFATLAELRPAIDKFFTDVLVMAQDEKIKQNRLALVWQVNELFRQLADFRLIVQE